MEGTRNKVFITRPHSFKQEFSLLSFGRVYTDVTWAEGTAPRGCAHRPTQRPEWRGRHKAPRSAPFWRESDKSRVREGSALALSKPFRYDAAAVLVLPLRGPHLSTSP